MRLIATAYPVESAVMSGGTPWWKTAVIYQVYPRSFADSGGDGIGDLPGIIAHLDHLAWLGVDALWLSPFYRSPMADFGYDVADYCDVDPLFGSLADFDDLVSAAHERGLRVIVDWVPNHTSDQHPWFVESRSGRDSPKRDWYVWRDPAPDGGPPNNWVETWGGGPAWTLDPASGQYYLRLFLPAQPDLNWQNPEVRHAMFDVVRFWLDRGVDGFRIDVVHALGKDPALPDDPAELIPIPHSALHHDPRTHAILRELRQLLDAYPGEPMMVGEVYLLDTHLVAEHYGDGDELHLAFNFPPLYCPWERDAWRDQIERAEAELGPRGAWPTWVLSNHDNRRHRTRYGTEARARAAAVLLLTLRGTPFLYAGEELGLEDAEVPAERRVDPGDRDGCRAPLPWNADPRHGWPVADPWLPWPPHPDELNVATEQADPGSMLHLYRRLLAERHRSAALATGACALLEAPPGVLAYERVADDDRLVVLVNFTDQARPIRVTGTVLVASDGQGEGLGLSGELGADQAVVVRPDR